MKNFLKPNKIKIIAFVLILVALYFIPVGEQCRESIDGSMRCENIPALFFMFSPVKEACFGFCTIRAQDYVVPIAYFISYLLIIYLGICLSVFVINKIKNN